MFRNKAGKYSQVAVTDDDGGDDDDDDNFDEVITSGSHDHSDVGNVEMVGFNKDDGNNNDVIDDEDESFHDEEVLDDDDDEASRRRNFGASQRSSSRILRQQQFSFDVLEEQLMWNVWNRWEEPTLLSILVTSFLLLPTLILWMYGAFAFVGRFWSIWIFVLPLQLRISLSSWYIKSISTVSFKYRRSLRILCSLMTLLELILLLTYHAIGKIVIEAFFRDVDGSIVTEWDKEVRFLRIATTMNCVGLPCMIIRTLKIINPDSYREWRPTFWTPMGDEHESSLNDATRTRLYGTFRGFNILVFGVHIVCILSAMSHFGPWPLYSTSPQDCDPLDDHECALPFPSFHHMREDPSSSTGWRVHLRGLPPLRGGIPFHPHFLNELDGFSTSTLCSVKRFGCLQKHRDKYNLS
jgi:hypothetical protein